MRIKKTITILLELVFIGLQIAYLHFMIGKYSFPSVYPFDRDLFDCLLLAMVFVSLFFGPVLNKYFVFFLNGSVSFYLIGQRVHFKVFGSYFRIAYASTWFAEVKGFVSSLLPYLSFNDLMPILVNLGFTILFIVVYFLVEKRNIEWYFYIAVSFLSLTLYYPVLHIYDSMDAKVHTMQVKGAIQYNEDYYLYDTIADDEEFVERFGLFTFAYRNFKEIMEDYKADIGSLPSYLSEQKEQRASQNSGMFKGRNVLFIQAESFQDTSIDEELTPVLFKMKTEGILFSGFSQPLMVGGPSDSEFMSNTSLIPYSDRELCCYHFSQNHYPTTLAGVFSAAGYQTNAYYNGNGADYNRDRLYISWGYDSFKDHEELGLSELSSNQSFLERITQDFSGKRMDYWITSDQPQQKYIRIVKEKYPDMDEEHISYLAVAMDLDQALASFLEKESHDEMEDTVIVLFGDGIEEVKEGSDYLWDVVPSDLIFYCAGVEPQSFEKTSSCLDLLPTVGDLFGLNYDVHQTLGHNIMDPDYEGFSFASDGHYRTDEFRYDPVNDEVRDYLGKKCTLDDAPFLYKMMQLRGWSHGLLVKDFFAER